MPRFASWDETELEFRLAGTGPLLVCIPGGPGQAVAYLGDLGGLSKHRTLVLLDNRGTGASALPADPTTYSVGRLVADIEALRQHLGLDRMDLFGHSASGGTCLLYAATFPHRLNRLVLVSPSLRVAGLQSDIGVDEVLARRTAEPWHAEAVAALRAEATTPDELARLKALAAPLLYGAWTPEAQAHAHAEPQQFAKAATDGFYAGFESDPTVPEGIATPVLLVAGEHDIWPTAASVAELAARMPNARVVVQQGAGHFPWVDEPTTFTATVERFLDGAAFPLRVSGNGRHLVDQNDEPFRLNAEAAWFFSTHATAAEIEQYLDDRKRRGFTALVVMAMVHPGGYDTFPGLPAGHMATVPRNVHTGEGPLATPGDFKQLNEAYWRHVDLIISEAGRRGMAVLLAYTYLGYQGGAEGWWDDVNQPHNDADVMFDFGRRLAQRYRTDPNIIWYPCGDYAPPAGSEGARRVLASIAGIRDVLPDALFAAELNAPDDLVADHPEFAGVLDLESFYGFGPDENGEVYQTARRAWDASPPRPAFVCEPPYEGTPIGSTGSRTDIRRAEWYSVLGGGTAGQNFGTHGVWNVIPELWNQGLGSPGTNDLQHQFALYAQMPWWELEPRGGPGDGLKHVAVAQTPDGSWLLAYVPPGVREFTLDIPGTGTKRWFNPTSGRYQPAEGGPTFTTPGDNGTGEDDWVLVVTTNVVTTQPTKRQR